MLDDGSETRERVFDYIVRFKQKHDGLSPYAKEIADACTLSVSSVKYHLLRLESEQRIRLSGRRGIEVMGGSWRFRR